MTLVAQVAPTVAQVGRVVVQHMPGRPTTVCTHQESSEAEVVPTELFPRVMEAELSICKHPIILRLMGL